MSSALPPYFDKFVANIRLTPTQQKNAQEGHQTLQERLENDPTLKPIVIATFLQGSFRRGTSVKPHNGKRADVDVVVVTNLSQEDYPDPEPVFREFFIPFAERYYPGKLEKDRDHSIGINLAEVDLDLVPTSAPSLAIRKMVESDAIRSQLTLDDPLASDLRFNEFWMGPGRRPASIQEASRLLAKAASSPEWQSEPLLIPNRMKDAWEPTDPIEQLKQTQAKNLRCGGNFLAVVRAVRWWRRLNATPKYPKGYPAEHLVWVKCPDGVTSVAEGVVRSLEGIRDLLKPFADAGQVPFIPDHGVPSHNVLERLTAQDIREFHSLVVKGARLARTAYECNGKDGIPTWRELFGAEFPDDPEKGQGGYQKPTGPSVAVSPRFG
jgi:hypothetical protein